MAKKDENIENILSHPKEKVTNIYVQLESQKEGRMQKGRDNN